MFTAQRSRQWQALKDQIDSFTLDTSMTPLYAKAMLNEDMKGTYCLEIIDVREDVYSLFMAQDTRRCLKRKLTELSD